MRQLLYILFFLLAGAAFSPIGAYAADIQKNADRFLQDNLLLVEVAINRLYTNETIEIYQHDGGYLVPLGMISDIVDFAIDVDIENFDARGWFVEEGRLFYLNPKSNEVVIGGISKKLDERLIVKNYDDIYVDSSFLADWFDIDSELNFSDLILKLKPRGKLPVLERLEREKIREKLQSSRVIGKDYDILEAPYKLYDIPFIDAEVGYDYSSDSGAFNHVSYSVLSQGDLGYLTTHVSLSGEQQSDEDEDSLTGLRINAGRQDAGAKLLGKMQATSFLLGDITAASTPLVNVKGRGRGFTVTNSALDRPDQFDSTSFVGDSQPGWEVELYRNGMLQDYQIVGDDGRYEFNDIPIFVGNNTFRVVSYGPQGQIREETTTQNINSSILQQGEISYKFSADEKSRTIFGVDEGIRAINHKPGMRYVGGVEYGITNRMTVGLGAVRTPIDDDKIHEYQSLSLKNNFGGTFTDLNLAYDSSDGGWASKLALQSSIKDMRVRAEHSFYNDFTSEVESASSQRRKSLTKLDFDGRYSGLWRGSLSYRLGGKFEKFENNRDIITLNNRLSTSVYGIGFSNNIQYLEASNDSDTTNDTSGDFSIRGRYRGFSLRLSADYQITPEQLLHSLNFVTQKRLWNDTSLRFGVRKDLRGESLTTINTSLNKTFEYFTLSGLLQGDDEDNYSAGVRLSFSIGREPRKKKWMMNGRNMSSSGAVSARAFLDDNYNHIFDDGEEVIQDVGFISRAGKFAGDGDNPVMIMQTASQTPAEIEVDFTTLENPFWLSHKQGYGVIHRPGAVAQVDFAFAEATEIDGTVYLQSSGSVRPLSRSLVNLLDENGKQVQQVKSEFDGFYLFEAVLPGVYNVQIDAETLARFNGASSDSKNIIITKDSDIISGIDLTIK